MRIKDKWGLENYEFIFVIALLFCPVSFSKSTYTQTGSLLASGNWIRFVFAGICMAIIVLGLLVSKKLIILKDEPKSITFIRFYWIFGGLSLLSTSWFSYSLGKYIEYGVLIIGICYIYMRSYYNKEIYEGCFLCSEAFVDFLLITVFIGLVISPSKALFKPENTKYSALANAVIPYLLNGYILPLSSTAVCSLSCISLYTKIVKRFEHKCNNRIINLIHIGILAMMAILSLSRIAIISLMLALFWYFFKMRKDGRLKLFFIILGITILFLFKDYLLVYLSRGQSTEDILSFTGRTKWWTNAIEVFKNGNILQKAFGFGFAAGEKAVAQDSSALMTTLDSDYFADLISCGLLGVFNIIIANICGVVQIIKVSKLYKMNEVCKRDKVILAETSGIMIIILIKLFTVTVFSLLSYYLIIYVFCLLVNWSILKKYKRGVR